MQRALMWLNLYGHQAVRLKKGVKMHFLCVYHFLSLRLTAWWPYKLSHINALWINLSYSPKDQSLKSLQKNIDVWRSWKWHFLVFGFWLLGFSKKNCLFLLNGNQLGFHMRYHLFLLYGWFLQNLGKDYIRTNMHTNVHVSNPMCMH